MPSVYDNVQFAPPVPIQSSAGCNASRYSAGTSTDTSYRLPDSTAVM